jgi:hypothetical protein
VFCSDHEQRVKAYFTQQLPPAAGWTIVKIRRRLVVLRSNNGLTAVIVRIKRGEIRT